MSSTPGRRVTLTADRVLWIALVFLAASTASALAAPVDGQNALYAIFLDPPDRAAQARAEGFELYSQFSSAQGEVLLVGAPPEVAGRSAIPLVTVDEDITGAVYYLARPPAHAAPVPWSRYGSVRLQLKDQVLLRASPEQAERLLDLGVRIARLALEAQPWPAVEPSARESAVTGAPSELAAITPDPDVQAIIDQVSTDTLSSRLAELTGAQATTVGGAPYTITRRQTYSGAPIQKATQFVSERLQALGLSVESHTWGSTGTPAPATYPNVVGQITGTVNPGDVYVIGAHLDDMPASGTAPGADDNASGSIGTLVAAEILSQYQWTCTLRFAFWTGEEQGMLGSAAYAARAKSRGENIRGYLNLDMIAYNSGAPNEINLYSRSSVPGSVAMMDLFADAVATYGLNLVPVKYPNDYMGNYSDNKSFWDKGYASLLASEDYYGDETPMYHTSGDTLSTLDMAYYAELVKAALATFVHVSGCLVPGTPPAPPSPPENLTASAASTSRVDLAWSDSDSETGYEIERCSGGGCNDFTVVATPGANATGYADAGLAASTSYSYRVRARNAGGTSDYSNVATAATLAAPAPPVPPGNLTASAASSSRVDLAWIDSDSETSYEIERCTGVGCADFSVVGTPGANATGYADAGLAASTSYSYRVRARNAGGTSKYSNVATAVTLAAPTRPAAPSSLTATAVSRNQVRLAWTDNAANETGFYVQRCKGVYCTSFTRIATLAANVTSYVSGGLSAYTTYRFRVQAYNAAGTSTYSNVATAKTTR